MSLFLTRAPSGASSIAYVSTPRKASRRARWLATAAAGTMMGSVLLASPAHAAITNFTNGAADFNWFTPGNWSTVSVPAAGDTANMTAAAGGIIVAGAPGAAAANLNLDQNTFRVTSGGTLTVSGTMEVGPTAGGATLI